MGNLEKQFNSKTNKWVRLFFCTQLSKNIAMRHTNFGNWLKNNRSVLYANLTSEIIYTFWLLFCFKNAVGDFFLHVTLASTKRNLITFIKCRNVDFCKKIRLFILIKTSSSSTHYAGVIRASKITYENSKVTLLPNPKSAAARIVRRIFEYSWQHCCWEVFSAL